MSKEEIKICLKKLHHVMNNFDDRLCDDMQEVVREVKDYIQQLEDKIKRLEFEVQAREQVHEYDVKMIDEAKGEAVKEWKEKRQLEDKVKELTKGQNSLMQSRKKWKYRYYKVRKKTKEKIK